MAQEHAAAQSLTRRYVQHVAALGRRRATEGKDSRPCHVGRWHACSPKLHPSQLSLSPLTIEQLFQLHPARRAALLILTAASIAYPFPPMLLDDALLTALGKPWRAACKKVRTWSCECLPLHELSPKGATNACVTAGGRLRAARRRSGWHWERCCGRCAIGMSG